MTSTQQIIEVTEKYGAHNYHPLPIVIAEAEGIWVKDPEGNKYADMLSAYSAMNHGHRHPEVIAALKAQADKVTVTSRAFHNDQLGPFTKELTELCGMEIALPMNSGAEAVETAIKAARKWGYRVKGVPRHEAEIIVCENNFHGRTVTVVSFSTEAFYRDDFGPFTPGFKAVPFGDAEALEKAITKNTVAFLVEPIQGEAGVVVPPEGYLKKVREICDRHKVLLILDEIQTGLGRTGKLFAHDFDGIKPDMMTLGKALGGGVMPISATLGSREDLGLFRPGEHGSTFGGNPLACAVARKAIEVLVRDNLTKRSEELGNYFMERLRGIQSPIVDHVRGKGLLIGVVLKTETGGARPYCERLMKEGLLCKETHDYVIRFAPPLIIKKEEIDWALERVEKVLK
ncbi:MAG TPA: ornithine--oxo-acid transaminase [Myxococcales bacterium]|jgi:ornithine--oxo-acid transaminase|nr:ornithine--oxo-acid transaminase [Myxococcales bacterium]